jgi:hypothetical protein
MSVVPGASKNLSDRFGIRMALTPWVLEQGFDVPDVGEPERVRLGVIERVGCALSRSALGLAGIGFQRASMLGPRVGAAGAAVFVLSGVRI